MPAYLFTRWTFTRLESVWPFPHASLVSPDSGAEVACNTVSRGAEEVAIKWRQEIVVGGGPRPRRKIGPNAAFKIGRIFRMKVRFYLFNKSP